MKKIDSISLDLREDNIKKLKQLFPNAVIEGKIDFDILRNLLGDEVDDSKEKYQFTWKGKAQSIKLAQSPSRATLRPDKSSSKNWDTTENLYIEGDNLEVLKQLQKTYYGKIKMIYIDPPYNTGKDFVYNDNFNDSLENYKQLTNQYVKSNPDTNGRYHTNWLNMIYPRLLVAKNLLNTSGFIFVSIDDYELENLKIIMNEIFGENNFVGQWNWLKSKTPPNLSKKIKKNLEYILCYQKNTNSIVFKGLNKISNSDDPIIKPQNSLKVLEFKPGTLHFKISSGSYEPGIYGTDKYPNTLLTKLIINNGLNSNTVKFENRFIWTQQKLDSELENNTIINVSNSLVVSYKKNNYSPEVPPNLIDDKVNVDTTENAGRELLSMFNEKIFDYPKPISLIKYLINFYIKRNENETILDFFSGSASTAHAVMKLNAEDGGNRKFIMVQLPELCDEKSEAYKAGYKNICEIGEERIRRAGEQIRKEWEEEHSKDGLFAIGEEFKTDIGFKVFKLDSTNINEWDSTRTLDEIELSRNLKEVFKTDRSKEDVLYEIMLKYGVFDMPVSEIDVNDKTMYRVGKRYMIVCLDDSINCEDIKAIAQLQPKTVIFNEAGFKDDNDKINAEYNLQKAGVEDVKCI